MFRGFGYFLILFFYMAFCMVVTSFYLDVVRYLRVTHVSETVIYVKLIYTDFNGDYFHY